VAVPQVGICIGDVQMLAYKAMGLDDFDRQNSRRHPRSTAVAQKTKRPASFKTTVDA